MDIAIRLSIAMSLCLWLSDADAMAATESTADQRQHFEQSIRPLFETHCVKCHGREKQESGLRLDSAKGAFSGGDSGASIVPHDIEGSLLISAVRREGLEMPPDKPLPSSQIKLLEDWIAAGAIWPDYEDTAVAASSADAAKLDLSEPAAAGRDRRQPLEGIEEKDPADADVKHALQLWLSADAITQEDRSAVTYWPDKSGHERHARPTVGVNNGSGAAPTFVAHGTVNGRAAVRFAESDGLATPAAIPPGIQGDSPYTVMVVGCIAAKSSGSPASGIVGFGDPDRADNRGRAAAALLQISRSAGGDILQNAGGFGLDVNFGHGSANTLYNRPVVLTVIKTPGPAHAATRVLINGETPESFVVGGPVIPAGEPEILHRQDVGVIIGHALSAVGGFAGDLSEVLIYNTALTDAQRIAIEAGLVRKHGIFDRPAPSDAERQSPKDDLWAFRPMVDWRPPTVENSQWCRTGVDNFILSQLERRGLSPAPPVDRRLLVRRLHYDLLGLPPSPELVERFVNASSPDAYPRLVEELLSSPYYGERWGRHWLDVARYADSGGYETDVLYRNAWRYRDYVVRSFNEDKPYDQFVQEQIAGDEIWPDNLDLDGQSNVTAQQRKHLEARIGTGLFTFGPMIHESNMDADKVRYEALTDWVDTAGSAFLGLTLGCARCHDHKFDPISQRDYFAMQALFSASKEVELPLITAMEIADHKQHYPKVLAVEERRIAIQLFDARVAGREQTEPEKSERLELMRQLAQTVLELPGNATSAPNEGFDELMQIPTATVLGHHEPYLQPQIHLLQRGDLGRNKERIEPDLPASLRQATSFTDPLPGPFANRKALALWITRPDHPLTARVMTNRIWQWHFGAGLVPTTSDFGKMGVSCSHPELLDWLSLQFIRGGWSVKSMHRLIVLSSTYQMSSAHSNVGAAEIDPDNRLLWRMNRQRLEAEAMWDFIHSTSGKLNLKIGGRPVSPPLSGDEVAGAPWITSADPAQQVRRGLYILTRRNFRYPMFDIFDSAINAVSSPSRDVTIVAPQALWALNNPRVFQQSQEFAARLVREAGTESGAWIDRAWMLTLSRPPTDAEREEAVQILSDFANATDVTPLDSPPAELAKLPPAQAAALTKLCLALFNTNEFFFIE